MINPSIEGLVKIGKTTRAPEVRAKELSQATGVPTPFYVAFSIEVSDCHYAEEYVYAVLAHNGFNRSPNREFFEMTLKDAIQVLTLSEQYLRQQGGIGLGESAECETEPPMLEHPGIAILEKAGAVYWGIRDEIKDQKEALRLLYQAKSLDYGPAYTALAEYFMEEAVQSESKQRFEGDNYRSLELREQALNILNEGARKGHGRCFVKMSEVYSAGGTLTVIDSWPEEPDSATKCWKKYFRSATFKNDDDLKWGWGPDWDYGPYPQSRVDYSRRYLYSAFLGSIPWEPDIRDILLPLRGEIIADIRRSNRIDEEQHPGNPVRNSKFLEFVEERLYQS